MNIRWVNGTNTLIKHFIFSQLSYIPYVVAVYTPIIYLSTSYPSWCCFKYSLSFLWVQHKNTSSNILKEGIKSLERKIYDKAINSIEGRFIHRIYGMVNQFVSSFNIIWKIFKNLTDLLCLTSYPNLSCTMQVY